MRIVDREYAESHREEMINAVLSGSIFIYPTDTIYGLGCNALLTSSVVKLRELKCREEKPFSVIAPSKDWIIGNCEVDLETLNKYLPGPYTLFVRKKADSVSREVNLKDDTLGVRIPDHWFTGIISEAGVPFVTTSVNLSGEKHMEDLESLSEGIKSQVDYIVYEGKKGGEPSTKINLVS